MGTYPYYKIKATRYQTYCKHPKKSVYFFFMDFNVGFFFPLWILFQIMGTHFSISALHGIMLLRNTTTFNATSLWNIDRAILMLSEIIEITKMNIYRPKNKLMWLKFTFLKQIRKLKSYGWTKWKPKKKEKEVKSDYVITIQVQSNECKTY